MMQVLIDLSGIMLLLRRLIWVDIDSHSWFYRKMDTNTGLG